MSQIQKEKDKIIDFDFFKKDEKKESEQKNVNTIPINEFQEESLLSFFMSKSSRLLSTLWLTPSLMLLFMGFALNSMSQSLSQMPESNMQLQLMPIAFQNIINYVFNPSNSDWFKNIFIMIMITDIILFMIKSIMNPIEKLSLKLNKILCLPIIYYGIYSFLPTFWNVTKDFLK